MVKGSYSAADAGQDGKETNNNNSGQASERAKGEKRTWGAVDEGALSQSRACRGCREIGADGALRPNPCRAWAWCSFGGTALGEESRTRAEGRRGPGPAIIKYPRCLQLVRSLKPLALSVELTVQRPGDGGKGQASAAKRDE